MLEHKLPDGVTVDSPWVLISDTHGGLGDAADTSDWVALNAFVAALPPAVKVAGAGDIVECQEQTFRAIEERAKYPWMWLCRNEFDILIAGNHDDALRGVQFQYGSYAIGSGPAKVWLEHGHAADPWNRNQRAIHGWLARANRSIHNLIGRDPQAYIGKVAGHSDEPYLDYACEQLIVRDCKVVCMGHTHRPGIWEWPHGMYVNTGCFTAKQKDVTLLRGVSLYQGGPSDILGVLQGGAKDTPVPQVPAKDTLQPKVP